MKTFCCKKCGSADVFIKERSPHKGLYCGDCGAFIQWLSKEDLRLVERFLDLMKQNDKDTK